MVLARTSASRIEYLDTIDPPNDLALAELGNFYQNTTTGVMFICDDPTVGSQVWRRIFPQLQTDWNASSGLAQIANKPMLAPIATSGSYTDLTNKPTIPSAQVNSDWNASSGLAQVLNKPTLSAVATS